MTQLHLFPTILRMIELEADSPKKAFYRLMIEECQGAWSVVKESGANDQMIRLVAAANVEKLEVINED